MIAKRNRGLNSSFIVRKISSGEGVERTFQLYSPLIASIEVKRRGDVRRAKLYYLRERSGKSARIKGKAGLIVSPPAKLPEFRSGRFCFYAWHVMSRPLILRPHEAPVVSVDAHLPAVSSATLSESAIRARLASAPSWQPEFAGDGSRFAGRAPAAAAVLVPMVVRDDGLHLLLTRRTDHLRDHAGQISFPGGKSEPKTQAPSARPCARPRRNRPCPRAHRRHWPVAGLRHGHRLPGHARAGAGAAARLA